MLAAPFGPLGQRDYGIALSAVALVVALIALLAALLR